MGRVPTKRKTGLLPHTAFNLTSTLRMWGKGGGVGMCVAALVRAHVYTCVVVRVKVFFRCLSKCVFWLVINPSARERKTILALSSYFSQFLTDAKCVILFSLFPPVVCVKIYHRKRSHVIVNVMSMFWTTASTGT